MENTHLSDFRIILIMSHSYLKKNVNMLLIEMGTNLGSEIHVSSYVRLPHLPGWVTPLTSCHMLLSSSLTVWPASGRSMGFPALPPWLIAYSDKEAGQANSCSCWRLAEHLKRRRRGVCASWWVGNWLGRQGQGMCGTCGAMHTTQHKTPNQGSCLSLVMTVH